MEWTSEWGGWSVPHLLSQAVRSRKLPQWWGWCASAGPLQRNALGTDAFGLESRQDRNKGRGQEEGEIGLGRNRLSCHAASRTPVSYIGSPTARRDPQLCPKSGQGGKPPPLYLSIWEVSFPGEGNGLQQSVLTDPKGESEQICPTSNINAMSPPNDKTTISAINNYC